MTVKEILASAYVLLGNISEEELDYVVAVEQFGAVISMMRLEKILSSRDERIRKASVSFSDTTGIVTNSLTDFGTPIFLRFNDIPIEECAVSQLDMLEDSGRQAVAFWQDASDDTDYIELSIPQTGTLDVWYEPLSEHSLCHGDTVEMSDYLRYAIVCRLAATLIKYVHYKDPMKEANKAVVAQGLMVDAEMWKRMYLDEVARVGTGLPFQRLPFMAR